MSVEHDGSAFAINNLSRPQTVVTALDRTVTIPDYVVRMPETLVTLDRKTQFRSWRWGI
jgi:hypothetical protein